MTRYAWHIALCSIVACMGAFAAAADEAPADAWPMFRGSPSGTGRSAGSLRLPLSERWKRSFEKTSFEATPVIAAGTIYIGDLDGTFHALALDTGETRWTHRTESGFPSAAAVSIDAASPLVVVGDGDGIVRAFDARSGAVRWEYETEGEISGGPTILPGPDGPRVLVGSQDASLSCLALGSGAVLWKHSIADQIRCSPTVAGGSVLLAGCDGKLHVIDVDRGEERSAVPIGGPTGTTPAADGSRVFFGTEGGVFFAIDVKAGAVAWKVAPAANAQSYRSSAAVAEGRAIVGTRGRAIEAFLFADGTRAWRTPLRGRVDGSPVVVRNGDGSGFMAVVGDAAGRIVALQAADGKPLWEFDAGGGFAGSPAVAAGRVVMAADDGTLWCFQEQDR